MFHSVVVGLSPLIILDLFFRSLFLDCLPKRLLDRAMNM